MRFPARLLIGLLVVLVLIASIGSISSVNAQTNPYLAPNTNPDVPQNLNTWTQNVMINLLSAGICQLAGVNPLDPTQACLGVDPSTGKIGFVPTAASGQANSGQAGGAIGVAGYLIAATFTHPPVSTGDYFSYMGSKFGIVEPAYAQVGGVGFGGLKPLVKVWEVFRNMTYLVFVVVFVVIGLFIMLRVKIDPRTVMTIQNSIPKIVIGLVLVTFSFAISGFLIDMMYVAIFFTFGLFENIQITDKFAYGLQIMKQNYQSESVISVFKDAIGASDVIGGAAAALGKAVAVGFGAEPKDFAPSAAIGILGGLATLLATLIAGIPGLVIAGAITAVAGVGRGFVEGGAGQAAGTGAALLALIIIFIAVIWALFRLFMSLLQAYIWILIDIVFAPLWILGGLFPNSPVSFSAWLRDLLAHLSAFPTTIFMLLLGKAFIEGFGSPVASGTAFSPPLIGAQSVEAMKAFIGLGFILLTPQVVTMVKDAFKAPKFPYGAAIGQAVGVGAGAVNLPQHVMSFAQMKYYLGPLKDMHLFGGLLGRRRESKTPGQGPS